MCLNLGLPLTSVTRWLYSVPNYSILRRDADEPGHTGIAVYVHNSIRDFTHSRYDLESTYVESICLQVKTGRGPPFLIAFIYRSPSSTLVWFDEIVVMMERVPNSKHHNEILLLGDFGLNKIVFIHRNHKLNK